MALLLSFGIACGVFFFFPYSEGYGAARVPLISQFISISGQGEDWQHCIFVPFLALGIALWLIYLKPLPTSRPFKPAIFGVIASLFLFFVGYRMSTHYIGFFAIQGFLISSIAFTSGWATLQRLIFPLIFLAFAWPLPFLDSIIAFPLRILMSKASVIVLNFIGVPVVLQGTGILSAPDVLTGLRTGQRFSVDVADPCSGIRSLFALMMVSALYGYFTLKEWWQNWILFLCSMPLAILGNLCRILMLTFGTMAMGPAVAIGTLENPSFFHMAAGYVVFAVALGGMISVGWTLQALPKWLKGRNEVASDSAVLLNGSESPPPSKEKIAGKKVDPY